MTRVAGEAVLDDQVLQRYQAEWMLMGGIVIVDLKRWTRFLQIQLQLLGENSSTSGTVTATHAKVQNDK